MVLGGGLFLKLVGVRVRKTEQKRERFRVWGSQLRVKDIGFKVEDSVLNSTLEDIQTQLTRIGTNSS